jgi:hypothetical protein
MLNLFVQIVEMGCRELKKFFFDNMLFAYCKLAIGFNLCLAKSTLINVEKIIFVIQIKSGSKNKRNFQEFVNIIQYRKYF